MNYLKHYVIVDDDSTCLLICEFMIRNYDKEANIKLYNQPEDALEHIKRYANNPNQFQVVLFLDINMPTMTGWEFLNHFNNMESRIKERFSIFILSSSIEDFSKEMNKYSFVSRILAKPFHTDYLIKIMEEKRTSVET